jgi:membrane-associated phospholipid phosphatase
MPSLMQFELAVTFFFQQAGLWLVGPMKLFSQLGQEEFFMAALPAIYWCVDPALGLRIGVILATSNALNCFFKVSFHSPRPYWVDSRVHALASETSFGFPSNHAQTAASVWGITLPSLRNRWGKAVVLLVVFLIGLSRIYLGVHFTSDVIFGWLIGAALIAILLKVERPILNWFQPLNFGTQIGTLFIFSLVFILIFYIPVQLLSSWTMPGTWVANAHVAFPDITLNPFDPQAIYTVAGTFFGLTAGAAWLFRYRKDYCNGGDLRTRFFRYIVGVVGLVILYLGMSAVFPRNPDMLSYGLRFFKYSLLSCYVTALAPLLFLRLGVSQNVDKV